jgi:hypothetical protein
MCGGVLLVLKVPRIPLIVYLLRAEFRWRWVWNNSRRILTGKSVSTRSLYLCLFVHYKSCIELSGN